VIILNKIGMNNVQVNHS